MNTKQKIKCNAIIHTASAAAAIPGAGLAQIPCSDNLIITPIQLSMTIALAQVFGISLSKSTAEASLASAAGATVGRAASQMIGGWIPGYGNAVNAVTAAAVTESIGWVIAKEFEKQAA